MKKSWYFLLVVVLLVGCSKPDLGDFSQKGQLLTKTIDSTFNCSSQISLVSELMESKYELNVLVESPNY